MYNLDEENLIFCVTTAANKLLSHADSDSLAGHSSFVDHTRREGALQEESLGF